MTSAAATTPSAPPHTQRENIFPSIKSLSLYHASTLANCIFLNNGFILLSSSPHSGRKILIAEAEKSSLDHPGLTRGGDSGRRVLVYLWPAAVRGEEAALVNGFFFSFFVFFSFSFKKRLT